MNPGKSYNYSHKLVSNFKYNINNYSLIRIVKLINRPQGAGTLVSAKSMVLSLYDLAQFQIPEFWRKHLKRLTQETAKSAIKCKVIILA